MRKDSEERKPQVPEVATDADWDALMEHIKEGKPRQMPDAASDADWDDLLSRSDEVAE